MCDDPCCDATTCQLAAGAVCSNREACCSNCQVRCGVVSLRGRLSGVKICTPSCGHYLYGYPGNRMT